MVNGRLILIVEDHEDNRIVYATMLEYSGYQVLQATNGEEGIRVARKERPDLILMDVSMPRIDGLGATRMLKADPATARIPVIMLTANIMAEDRERAQEAGCDGYLTKPIEPRHVVEAIEQMLGAASEPPERERL